MHAQAVETFSWIFSIFPSLQIRVEQLSNFQQENFSIHSSPLVDCRHCLRQNKWSLNPGVPVDTWQAKWKISVHYDECDKCGVRPNISIKLQKPDIIAVFVILGLLTVFIKDAHTLSIKTQLTIFRPAYKITTAIRFQFRHFLFTATMRNFLFMQNGNTRWKEIERTRLRA